MKRKKSSRISNQNKKQTQKKRRKRGGHRFRVNREYKDRLFCRVFEDRKDLLDLYNAVNGTDYTDPEALTVNTLEDVIYLGMRNDKSFLINGTMNLYEHNSTICPNLPLRGLLYFSRLYESYVETQGIRIYGRKRISLPTPQYVIFYNGTDAEEDRSEMRLSDAYIQKDMEPALECRGILLNINYGHNKALMGKCRRLKEYAILVSTVRKKLAGGKPLEQAVEETVDECIENNILRDILEKNRAEVIGMILTSFDQEEYEKTIRDESYEDGHSDGYKEGLTEGEEQLLRCMVEKKLSKGKSVSEIAAELDMEEEQILHVIEKMEKE